MVTEKGETMVLKWDKPKKVMTDAEWQSVSADGAPPGVYVPNMSEQDRLAWKAKAIGGKDPRIEIRKSVRGAQVLIVVRDESVRMSMNGTSQFSRDEWAELNLAVAEATEYLVAEE